MADVKCTNETCEEVDVVKENPADFPVEEIRCGRCGEPVEPATEP